MHKVRLIAVSKIKTPWVRDAAQLYIERLSHLCDFDLIEIPASEKNEESKRIIDQLKKAEGTVYLLDVDGKEHSSVRFSELIGKERDLGIPLTFVIGGAYGFTDELRSSHPTLSLSKMTLPHELCRILFVEQLYRAYSILAGSGYHH